MAGEHDEAGQGASRKGMSGYHKTVLALLCLLLVGSVAARAWISRGAPAGGGAPGTPSAGQGFLPGPSPSGSGAEAPGQEPDPLRDALPAVTEGSLFALIGFALGYTTRKLIKLGLVLLALGFVAVQVLVHLGTIEVDWSGLTETLNRWVMNLREDGTVQELLTDRIPTAGGLAAGYLLGLKRG